ncbi:hypothetical protein JTE90_011187 [Oedothorax gibbosus]|uniref:C2H2-type domain-containing protein n=1 Tax=Oedothorax gibbosus TaxID=931172 RepID=A0AAV6W174_9ARAC|nr:hypothetical protein JTE90_011187 [Oedothorax gibbosus]
MNVFTDILYDSSSLMSSQNYKETSHNKILSSQDMAFDEHQISVSQIHSNSFDQTLITTSPSEMDFYNSPNEIHLPSNTNGAFEVENDVSVFSDSFPEIVPSWLTHDFMKAASDSLPSPNILSNVSDMYPSATESEQLEMLDLGFPSDLSSQVVASTQNCISESQKLLAELPIQQYSNGDSLLMTSFSDVNMPDLQYQNIKQSTHHPISTHASLMTPILPCDSNLLHLPLHSSLTDQCLTATSSPNMTNGQSHPVDAACDKLPQINLNHLDSFLDGKTNLSNIQVLHQGFPNVGGIPNDINRNQQNQRENCPMVRQDLLNTCGTVRQDASVQATENSLSSGCYSCSKVSSEAAIEVVQCFKCQFCDFVSLHKCAVESHINTTHSNLSSVVPMARNEGSNNGQGLNASDIQNASNSGKNRITIAYINNKLQVLSKGVGQASKPSKSKQPKLLPGREPINNDSEDPGTKSTKTESSHKTAWKKKMTRELGSYICEFKGCNIRFRALDNLEYHKKCHVDSGSSFACPECGAVFESWGSIAGHLWRNHKNDMELHACDKCPFRTYSQSRLELNHKTIHLNECSFLCDECGKGFKNGKQMRNHRYRCHLKRNKKPQPQNPLQPKCKFCSTHFASRILLKHHEETFHNGKRKVHVCSYCDYTAKKKSTLEFHMRKHTGEKPFKCDQCDYRTSDHNSLRRHKMLHSGDKMYKCPFCPYSSIQASCFKAHMNKHPGHNGVTYSCEICPFKTVKRDTYILHVNDHKSLTILQNANSLIEINSGEEMYPMAAAMDISLSYGDNNLIQHLNQNKNVQSFFNSLGVHMVSVGQQSAT